MRILQLCHKPPNPPKDGGCIAMNNIGLGLMNKGHELKIITIFTHKHDFEMDNLPESYLEDTGIEGVFVDTKVNIVDAFSSLITQDSYNVSRFFSPDFDIKLSKLLRKKKFDVIHLESLFMAPYIGTIRRHSKAALVLRSHNLEYIIWERIASGTKNIAKKAYLKYLSHKLKEYELSVLSEVDGIAAISTSDQQKYRELGCDTPVINIPFGIDVANYQPAPPKKEISLFHLGAMDWRPNLEGVLWFVEEVWPLVSKRYPDLKLHLAGRGFSGDAFPNDLSNVVIHGEVEDAKQFMNDHSVMIVPLLSAGGIRVKIIEGMALGKAIVSTSVGAEGIDFIPGQHLEIANDPIQFANAIIRLVESPEAIEVMGKNARQQASSQFDNSGITDNLISFYQKLINE